MYIEYLRYSNCCNIGKESIIRILIANILCDDVLTTSVSRDHGTCKEAVDLFKEIIIYLFAIKGWKIFSFPICIIKMRKSLDNQILA